MNTFPCCLLQACSLNHSSHGKRKHSSCTSSFCKTNINMAKFTVCRRIILFSANKWSEVRHGEASSITPGQKSAQGCPFVSTWISQCLVLPTERGRWGDYSTVVQAAVEITEGSSVFSQPKSQQPAFPISWPGRNWESVWPLDSPLVLRPWWQQEWSWYYQIHSAPSAVHRAGSKTAL